MAAAVTLSQEPSPDPAGEQRILLYGVSWKDYVILRDVLDGPTPRMTYLEGALELMSPSTSHEIWKKNIARLLELYAYRAGIHIVGYGSATFKSELRRRGVEPDECYVVGHAIVEFPDIVLEVVHSSPLLDKRSVYAAMGIAELWVFETGAFRLYGLDRATETYVARAGSSFFPELDFAVVARYAVQELSLELLRRFEAEVMSR